MNKQQLEEMIKRIIKEDPTHNRVVAQEIKKLCDNYIKGSISGDSFKSGIRTAVKKLV